MEDHLSRLEEQWSSFIRSKSLRQTAWNQSKFTYHALHPWEISCVWYCKCVTTHSCCRPQTFVSLFITDYNLTNSKHLILATLLICTTDSHGGYVSRVWSSLRFFFPDGYLPVITLGAKSPLLVFSTRGTLSQSGVVIQHSDKQPWSTFLHNITYKNSKMAVEDALGEGELHKVLQEKSEEEQMINRTAKQKKTDFCEKSHWPLWSCPTD